MKKTIQFATIVMLSFFTLAGFWPTAAPAQISADERFKNWVSDFKEEALAAGIPGEILASAFENVHRIEKIIQLDRQQPEETRNLSEYLAEQVSASRIRRGREKLRIHANILADVSRHYGVEPSFIVALWGIESNFGTNQGSYPVISSLATLAFDGRRGSFFRNELLYALKMLAQDRISADYFVGSWAGALGQCQFLPSSYFFYARDFNGDGRIDIWNCLPDVFASIANYLARNGWKQDGPWGFEVAVPVSFDWNLTMGGNKFSLKSWREVGLKKTSGAALSGQARAALLTPDPKGSGSYLVFSNYDVLLRWNRSHYFAVAVGTLADALQAE